MPTRRDTLQFTHKGRVPTLIQVAHGTVGMRSVPLRHLVQAGQLAPTKQVTHPIVILLALLAMRAPSAVGQPVTMRLSQRVLVKRQLMVSLSPYTTLLRVNCASIQLVSMLQERA